MSVPLRAALDAVDEARKILLAADLATLAAREKGDRDLVTELDLRVEQEMRRLLADRTPEFGFLGEEEGTSDGLPISHQMQSGPVWVCDPIDGTSNLTRGLPLAATSLALIHDDRVLLGVVDVPFLDLRYFAVRGFGAHRGEDARPLRPRPTRALREAIVSIGDYAVGEDAGERNEPRLALTATLAAEAERIRMFGTAALDLVWAAEGRTDGCVILGHDLWSVAAGSLIAAEAGAAVSDMVGAPHRASSSSTIAAAPGIGAALTSLCRAALERGGFSVRA